MISIAETGLADGQLPGYDGTLMPSVQASGGLDPSTPPRSVPRDAGGVR